MLYTLDLIGTAVFAISGALAAGERRMDLFGVAVLAAVTAIGGGTLRDVVLGATPVFWIRDPTYVIVAIAAGIVTFLLAHWVHMKNVVLDVADAFGLALFTVIGAQAASEFLVSPVIVIILGVMTGAAGGIIRDVLANRVPLIFRRELYATAALCGAIALVLLQAAFGNTFWVVLAAGSITLAIRLSALRWHLTLPIFPAKRT